VGLVLLVACNRSSLFPCKDTDRACLSKAFVNHPVRTLSFWEEEMSKPRSARIGPAPAALLEYLSLGNKLDGFAERPRPANLDAAFLADVQAAIDEVPADVWRLADSRLVGIYFMEQLGGSGYTEYVRDPNGKPTHAFVVLDSAVLSGLTANAWATWKENTPFSIGGKANETLTATIAAPALDTRKSAIQYILLHELAHVLSVGRRVHPEWGNVVGPLRPGLFPFFDLSWTVDASRKAFATHFDAAWPQRTQVVYYLGAKLKPHEMVSAYEALDSTNFPTLYAVTNPADDFAESLVSYVHTVRMGKPWSINIQRANEVVHTLQPCWQQARCAQKRKVLEAILAGS